MRKATLAGDYDYLIAAQLFVAEEQQHAALLLRLLGYLGGSPMRRHWSDSVFVRLRRLMGLRTELMVLTVAEVVALSYYGGLAAAAPDPVVRAGFAASGGTMRLLAFGLWWVTAVGATIAVTFDHGPLLDAPGYRRRRFVRDVLTDFAAVARAVLG